MDSMKTYEVIFTVTVHAENEDDALEEARRLVDQEIGGVMITELKESEDI